MIGWTDTITAIATPPGEAGIAVIRLSGISAFSIADTLFSGKKRPSASPSHTIIYGKIINPRTSELVDAALLSIFRAPTSYTGEDMVEISCHGGTLVAETVLKILLEQGARLAEPGEFTKRAVLLGKMDITQAEAILDLIQAKSEKASRSAISQLTGSLSKIIDQVTDELTDILCQTENALEFEGDERFNPLPKIKSIASKVETKIRKIVAKGETERFLREGALVVIVGKPNVGKSSIFNRLLERERAIVTEIPGTTRDSLEERMIITGVPVRLVDTAGLRQNQRKIEALGIAKTNDYLTEADLVLAVFDNSKLANQEDKRVLNATKGKKHLFILNKIDLKNRFDPKFFNGVDSHKIVKTSARYNHGINKLRGILTKQFTTNKKEGYFITNRRHIEALKRAKDALNQVQKENYLETIAHEIRTAIDALSEITGKVTNEAILNLIFSKFCIGK
jgi:tRNA modification GTPase